LLTTQKEVFLRVKGCYPQKGGEMKLQIYRDPLLEAANAFVSDSGALRHRIQYLRTENARLSRENERLKKIPAWIAREERVQLTPTGPCADCRNLTLENEHLRLVNQHLIGTETREHSRKRIEILMQQNQELRERLESIEKLMQHVIRGFIEYYQGGEPK
jgi:regulator of replication initiation timing